MKKYSGVCLFILLFASLLCLTAGCSGMEDHIEDINTAQGHMAQLQNGT